MYGGTQTNVSLTETTIVYCIDLNLTVSTIKARQLDVTSGPKSSNKIEDDIARSLLDLSKTPVHGTPTPISLTPLKTEKPMGIASDVVRHIKCITVC